MSCARLKRTHLRWYCTHERNLEVISSNWARDCQVTLPQSEVITPRHFYYQDVIDKASRPHRPVSFNQLAFFGKNLNEKKLLDSANYVRDELTRRIAHRVEEMQSAPYKIMSNRHLTRVYERYFMAFEVMTKVNEIKTMDDNESLCKTLQFLLKKHNGAVPDFLIGIQEIMTRLPDVKSQYLDEFMRRMLMSRISRRMLAEQHLTLSSEYKQGITNSSPNPGYVGEIFLECNLHRVLEEASKRLAEKLSVLRPNLKPPVVEISGEEITMPYIKSHLDYALGEVLRNSMDATMRNHRIDVDSDRAPPPVRVTISKTKEHSVVRVSDQGGGIPPEVFDSIFSFAKPAALISAESQDNLGNFLTDQTVLPAADHGNLVEPVLEKMIDRPADSRLGVGLALAKIYMEYGSGSLEIQSLEGYGCDTFVQIPRLGTKLENLKSRDNR